MEDGQGKSSSPQVTNNSNPKLVSFNNNKTKSLQEIMNKGIG